MTTKQKNEKYLAFLKKSYKHRIKSCANSFIGKYSRIGLKEMLAMDTTIIVDGELEIPLLPKGLTQAMREALA